jgi:hypothetical protein
MEDSGKLQALRMGGKKALIPEDRRTTLVTEKRKFLAPACNHDLKSSAVQMRL